jgi:deoxyadenosine/deoxycytidine kinase
MDNWKGEYEVALLGCHGVGKTTICRELSKQFSIYYNDFKNENPFNESALKIMLFHLVSYKKRNESIRILNNEGQSCITDRCSFIDVTLYVKALRDIDIIDENEYKLYFDILKLIGTDWLMPKNIIVLTANTNEILERISERGGPKQGHQRGDDLQIIEATNKIFSLFGALQLPSDFWPDALRSLFRHSRISLIDTSGQTPKRILEEIVKIIESNEKRIL